MENQPQPDSNPEHVTCPGCGSVYAPKTRVLVTDTGLLAKIRQAEADTETYRKEAEGLRAKLDVAEKRIQEFEEMPDPPAPEPAPEPEPKKKKGLRFPAIDRL